MEKKDTILLFIKTPPPVTGSTVINQQVYESKLLRNKFDIRSICISYVKSLKEVGKWRISKIKIIFSVIKKLVSELYNQQPSFVYFNLSPIGFAFIRDLIYVSIIKAFNIKILFHLHGKGINEKGTIYKLLYKYCFKNQYIICLSNLLKYDLKDVYKGKVFVVPNGLPDQIYKLNGIIDHSQKDTINLLFLSNLMYSKGVYDFLETLTLLDEMSVKYKAQIVGSEYDVTVSRLKKLIYKNNLAESVEYLGPIYGKEKFKIFSHSDILVYPTHDDCFPSVIIEAFLTETCIIASREGAIPEMIDDGINGFLVDKKSPVQIAEKIKYLMSRNGLIQRMGNEGRKKYEQNYNVHTFENNMRNIFSEVLNKI